MRRGPNAGFNFFMMEQQPKTFKADNYITIPGFAIVELGLSGNELVCYALVHGFTQDRETEFKGSLAYIASALNVTRQNAKKIIDRLIDRGLIEKRELFFSGVKFCTYVANRNGVAEIATGCDRNDNGSVAEIATGSVAEIATNNTNKDNSINNTIDNIADGDLFPQEIGFVPVTVVRPKRTSEPLCLFENSRYSEYNEFEKQFTSPEFNDVDIVYYYHAVADWSAQKGKKMKDWIATARNFIRSDMEKGKLHRKNHSGPGLPADAIEYLELGTTV